MAVRSSVDVIGDCLDAAAAGDAKATADLCDASCAFDVVHRDAEGRDPFNAEGAVRFWQSRFAAFSSFDWKSSAPSTPRMSSSSGFASARRMGRSKGCFGIRCRSATRPSEFAARRFSSAKMGSSHI
jgi:hypothetical protein